MSPVPLDRERFRSWLPVALVYMGLALLVAHPVLSDPSRLVLGAPRSDVWNSLWSYWWVAWSLIEGSLPLQNQLLDHPTGGRLLVADPVNNTLAVPLVILWGPVLAHNLMALIHLFMAGVAAHALGRALGGSGWLAGVGFAGSALAVSHVHNGASEAISMGWLPIAGLLAWRLMERGGGLRTACAALGLLVAALSSWYLGVAAWILCGALAFAAWGRWGSRAALRLIPALALALLTTAPAAWGTRSVALAEDGLVLIKNAEDLHRLRRTLGPADPRVFVTPGDFRSPDFQNLEGNPGDYAHVPYVGLLVLVLALAGLARRRAGRGEGRGEGATDIALGVAAVSGAALAMGPVLVMDGMPASVAGRALPLPYALIERLPGFDSLSLLYRLSAVTILSLALLADRAVVRWPWLRRLAPVLAAAALAEVLLLSPARDLPAHATIPEHRALQALAEAPPGAVVNLPVAANRAYLFEQTLHGKPLAGALNTGANRAAMEVLLALRKLKRGELDEAACTGVAREVGVRYVILHRNALVDAPFLPAVLALRELGSVLHEDEQVQVFTLW